MSDLESIAEIARIKGEADGRTFAEAFTAAAAYWHEFLKAAQPALAQMPRPAAVANTGGQTGLECSCPRLDATNVGQAARGEVHTLTGYGPDCPVHGINGTEPIYREVRE